MQHFTIYKEKNQGKGNCVLYCVAQVKRVIDCTVETKGKGNFIYGIEGYLSEEILSGFKCLGTSESISISAKPVNCIEIVILDICGNFFTFKVLLKCLN